MTDFGRQFVGIVPDVGAISGVNCVRDKPSFVCRGQETAIPLPDVLNQKIGVHLVSIFSKPREERSATL